MDNTSLYIAPVQGHTDAAFRHFHSFFYPGDHVYYTPFIRLEKDRLRPKDLKDLTNPLNDNHKLVPQIIFRDKEELNKLIELIKGTGNTEIDLNMGCPFPLQTGHGRGAATIQNQDLAAQIIEIIKANPDISFSVKMRLGLNDQDEWKILLPFLNQVKLKHITLHPRVAKQQYTGEVIVSQFESFLKESINPVVYNGDIKTPEQAEDLIKTYPKISGLMMARGLLGRPSLLQEISENKEWDREKRISRMLEFHRALFLHYSSVLCGDSQVLSKIQPFWEYTEEEIGRKAWKAIKKAGNISKYQTAVALIS